MMNMRGEEHKKKGGNNTQKKPKIRSFTGPFHTPNKMIIIDYIALYKEDTFS